MAMAVAAPALAAPPAAQALQARYAEYAPQLADNDFQRAMHIESAAAGNSLSGEIHAVLDHPFKRLSSALREPTSWCDVLILPFNTKFCRATTGGGALCRIDGDVVGTVKYQEGRLAAVAELQRAVRAHGDRPLDLARRHLDTWTAEAAAVRERGVQVFICAAVQAEADDWTIRRRGVGASVDSEGVHES